MLRLSLRNLLAERLRLLLTVASVTLGVAFVAGTFVLSDTMVKAFDELYTGLTAGTDVVVHARNAYEADVTTTGGQLRPLDASVVRQVTAVPGVASAEGAVAGFALIVAPDGTPIQPGGAPTFGTSVHRDRRMSGAARIRAGHLPHGPHELVVDARTVAHAGFHLGDPVRVVLQDGSRTFRLVGVVGFGDNDSLLGATMAGFDLPTAQDVLGKRGRVDEVDVRADDGVPAATLRARIAAELPAGVEAVTGQQAARDGTQAVRDALGVFTTVLLVFAGVALLVATFVIWNTFNVLVARRRRQVGLLRAVGATRRQVLAGVLLEAGVVGVLSGAAGLAGGVGLAVGIRSLLTLVGVELPTTSPALEPRTVVAAFAVGVLVTLLAALLPAWSATAVSPMEALRTVTAAVPRAGRVRHGGAWAVLVSGAAVLALSARAGDAPWWTLAGTLVTFLGLVFVGPSLARGTARLAGRGRPGGPWSLASRYVSRTSRRAAGTALALTVGLAVVSAVAVAASSLRTSVGDAVSGGNRADLVLQAAGAGLGVSPVAAERLRGQRDLSAVVEVRQWGAQVGGEGVLVTGVDAAGLGRVVDLGLETGRVGDLRPGRLLVNSEAAAGLGVGRGDRLAVTFPETGRHGFEVAGTFSGGDVLDATYVMAMPDFAANVTSPLDAAVLVRVAAGTGAADARASVARSVADLPNVEVLTPAQVTQEARRSVDQLLGIVTALLLLAVVIAVLGVVNTLALSVMERTRELALLRAVGATRGQVRGLVRRESLLMSVLGGLTGVALGVATGVALSRALVQDGITTVSLPVAQLLAYAAVAVVVGLLAAVGPAGRAGRTDVLAAVSSE